MIHIVFIIALQIPHEVAIKQAVQEMKQAKFEMVESLNEEIVCDKRAVWHVYTYDQVKPIAKNRALRWRIERGSTVRLAAAPS